MGHTVLRNVLLGLVLMGLVASTAVAAPGASGITEPRGDLAKYVRSEINGYASWIVKTDRAGRYRWYALEVLSDDDVNSSGDERFFFIAIRGRCRSTGGKRLSCSGAGKVRDLDRDRFTMTPDLSAARVQHRVGRNRYDIAWSAHQPAPGAYLKFETCVDRAGNEEHGQAAGAYRDASAAGRFGGRELGSSNHDHSMTFLSRGIKITDCDPFFPQADEGEGDGTLLFTWETHKPRG